MTYTLTPKFHDNILSTINDFIVGDTSYWKSKYTESVKQLNEIITDAKDELEYWSEYKIENTHWLSFHYAFLDLIKHHFEIVKCKQNNSGRILRCMKKQYDEYYYNEYNNFQEFKQEEYNFYCLKFIDWEKSVSSGKYDLVWESII